MSCPNNRREKRFSTVQLNSTHLPRDLDASLPPLKQPSSLLLHMSDNLSLFLFNWRLLTGANDSKRSTVAIDRSVPDVVAIWRRHIKKLSLYAMP
ncbi:hypothetical protein TNCV_3147181 [Trichonephila clavipes]|nr:hypothetical protein TNCV_3147181 [Trichonephila clavipes]